MNEAELKTFYGKFSSRKFPNIEALEQCYYKEPRAMILLVDYIWKSSELSYSDKITELMKESNRYNIYAMAKLSEICGEDDVQEEISWLKKLVSCQFADKIVRDSIKNRSNTRKKPGQIKSTQAKQFGWEIGYAYWNLSLKYMSASDIGTLKLVEHYLEEAQFFMAGNVKPEVKQNLSDVQLRIFYQTLLPLHEFNSLKISDNTDKYNQTDYIRYASVIGEEPHDDGTRLMTDENRSYYCTALGSRYSCERVHELENELKKSNEKIDNLLATQKLLFNPSYLKSFIVDDLTQETWDKLDIVTRSYLMTAASQLVNIKDAKAEANIELDYSGMVLMCMKALENELKIRFYTDYLEFLNARCSAEEFVSLNKIKYSSDRKNLIKTDIFGQISYRKNDNNDFTLGSFKHCLGIKETSTKIFLDPTAIEYLRIIVNLKNIPGLNIGKFSLKIRDELESLRLNRNDAAHCGTIVSFKDAETCLKKMINSNSIIKYIVDNTKPRDIYKKKLLKTSNLLP